DCLSPIFTPTQEGSYTFTLTVASPSGCSSTCQITICVLDIRVNGNCSNGNGNGGNSPGKVYVCHIPPGNPSNPQLICIGVAGVPAHVPLHGGDRLGRCNQVCGFAKTDEEAVPELFGDFHTEGFNLLVYPNPYRDELQILVESALSDAMTIKAFNVTGQLIFENNKAEPNVGLTVGRNFARGMYFIEITQGSSKRTVKIVKAE
ncbi:MAG: T9SS type A sorting domain-containing protein, partial [Bacteroidota bacterium]